jgi:hypothetical protein
VTLKTLYKGCCETNVFLIGQQLWVDVGGKGIVGIIMV